MSDLAYTNYTNVSASYEPGDTLIEGWSGTLTIDTTWVSELAPLAENIFEIHNRDDRPDGELCPSMSVGDVIVFGEIALTVEPQGFRICSIARSDIDTARTYKQWVAAL